MQTVSIPLANNKGVALIDEEDLPLVAGSSWFAMPNAVGTMYAARSGINRKGTKGVQFLHNVIMRPPDGKYVDHIHGDGLDNRKSELRICEFQENAANRSLSRNNTSSYKGVNWHKRQQKWLARVRHNKETYHLGSFDTAGEAAKAYDRKALLVFGEFAKTNFPREEYDGIVLDKQERRLSANNTAGFRGVSKVPRCNRWRAQINVNKEVLLLGTYSNPDDAARAYDAKARELLGSRARLNFPD